MRRSNGRRRIDNRNDGYGNGAHRLSLALSGKITVGTPAIARRICRLAAMATRCCTITACLPPLQQEAAAVFLYCAGLEQAKTSLSPCLRSSGSSRASLRCIPPRTEPACSCICNMVVGIFMRWRSWRPRLCRRVRFSAANLQFRWNPGSLPASLPALRPRAELPTFSSPGEPEA